MKSVILIALVITVIIIIGSLAFFGAFTGVKVEKGDIDEMWIVYDTFLGPYEKSAPISDKIYYDLLNNDSCETFKGFGIYFDNPEKVGREKCRSVVGCILEKKDWTRIEELKKKYKITKIPASSAVKTEFPFKGKLSIIFGIFKVYPALDKYMKTNKIEESPIMEIYDVPAQKIYYMAAPEIPFKEFGQY